MAPKSRTPTAIDLYAGVGGWALGLRMAGIEVVRSYEWWSEAADTHRANLGGHVTVGDIRELPLDAFPRGVDFVVGSPPCTQFSYSNRGGNGDIADGLRDIEKFLAVVEYVQPRAWAMENVPRVADILRREIAPNGSLARYSPLLKTVAIVDSSDWGVPQRRKRMIAGDFDMELLESFKATQPTRTLGDVVGALAVGKADPVYGWRVSSLTDNLTESPLTDEELRMNREQKTHHRVYNKMPFPEPMVRPSRTVTALCTRVSRESLVIGSDDGYRRLTVRERASLQSFPVSYQFLGKRHSSRVKMIGNAIPPLLTFHIGHAFLGTSADNVTLPKTAIRLASPVDSAVPEVPKRAHTKRRTFAAAIPGLRFGSGMRFDLSNTCAGDKVSWRLTFHYGPSKSATAVPISSKYVSRLQSLCLPNVDDWVEKVSIETGDVVGAFGTPADLQNTWCNGGFEEGPFALVDRLGSVVEQAESWLPDLEDEQVIAAVAEFLQFPVPVVCSERVFAKVTANAVRVLTGSLVCSVAQGHGPLTH